MMLNWVAALYINGVLSSALAYVQVDFLLGDSFENQLTAVITRDARAY